MSDTQIRMRFSAAGLKQIRDDLKAAGQDGSAAFSKVADAADKPNKALALTLRELEQVQQALRQAGREGDAAFKRIDGAVKTLNPYGNPMQARAPIGPQTSVQSRINETTGVSGQSYSAAASANAFMELEKRATALRDALNPTAEAERKLSAAVAEASTLLASGAITEAEHTAAVALARKEFSEAEKAARGLAGGVGLNRAQMMELGHVARSAADGLAAGQNPMRILAMEGGRLTQALGDGNGGVAGALGVIGRVIVSPIGLMALFATTAIAAGKAALDYADGQFALARAVMGSGIAYGASVDQLNAAAEAGANAADISVGAARKMEVQFLSTGRIGVAQMGGLIAISRDYAAATGQNMARAGESLARAFAHPAEGAAQLNEQLNFLTDAQLQTIRAMDDAGDHAGAQAAMQQALADHVRGAADNMTGLALASHRLSVGFGEAWDAAGKLLDQLGNLPSDIKIAVSFVPGLGTASDLLSGLFGHAPAGGSAQSARAARERQVSNEAGKVARETDPTIQERMDLNARLQVAQAAQRQNFRGLQPEDVAALRRDLQAIPRALQTLITPAQQEMRRAEIQAQLRARPGSAVRARLQGQLEQVNIAGQVYTPEEAQALVASNQEKGANIGARSDQSAARKQEEAARKAAAAAKEAATAQREWDAAKAEGLGVDHNLVDAENKIADLRQRGAKISAADAQAYLASAKLKDQAAAIEKSNEAAKANREWSQALSGVTHESGNLDRALDLIAKRTKDAAAGMKGVVAPTQAEIDRLTALAAAADRAAEATKALDAAKSAVKEASADVMGAQPEPKTVAGRYDPTAAQQQWQNARVAIYADAEQRIRADQTARVSAGEQTEQQAAENAARSIAALDAAYALQSVSEITAIKKKAAEDVVHYEEEQQQAFNNRIASTAADFGSAVMKLTTGAKIGSVGEDLAKQILQQILETLVSDPLVALIKQELQAIMSPQSASAGGVLGMLSTGLRMAFGAPGAITAVPNPVTAFPSASDLTVPAGLTGLTNAVPDITITPPGFATGTDSTPLGLHWVGERGPELSWKAGQSIMSAADSAGWIRTLQDHAFGAGSAAGGGSSPVLHYNPVIHMDATGADPAQLKRTQDAFSSYQRQEPARVAAYLRAAKLR